MTQNVMRDHQDLLTDSSSAAKMFIKKQSGEVFVTCESYQRSLECYGALQLQMKRKNTRNSLQKFITSILNVIRDTSIVLLQGTSLLNLIILISFLLPLSKILPCFHLQEL